MAAWPTSCSPGKPPFYDAEEPLAILLRHISEALPPAAEVADVDPEVSAWIERMTSKDPKDRPQSATIAWEEFEEIMIGKLGPRWRRDARLPALAGPSADGSEAQGGAGSDEWNTVTPVPGPATPPPPPGPAPTIEGIDYEGTGPDTGDPLPASEEVSEEPAYETYLPPPTGPPAAAESESALPAAAAPRAPDPARERVVEPDAPPAPELESTPVERAAEPEPAVEPEAASAATAPPMPTPVPTPTPDLPSQVSPPVPPGSGEQPVPGAGDLPVPPRVIVLAQAGALALLAGLLIPVLAEWPDRWNVFAVLSPFEAVGVGLATWIVAQALTARRISVSVAAGALVGFGGLTLIASIALLRFTINRLDALSVVLAIIVFLGAAATLAAGIGCLRGAERGGPVSTVDPSVLLLGLAGAALAGVAVFTKYDGFSSLWSELAEGESAEFVFEPAVLVVAILLGLGMLGGQQRVAAGLLLAVGLTTSVHYLGVLVAAWRAIGEVGDIKSAAFFGVLGGLLVVAAGALAHRAAATNRR